MAVRGWVLYDGRCGLCRGGVRRLAGCGMPRGFRLEPLQRRWVRARLAGVADTMPDEMLLLLSDGTVKSGVAVFLHLGRRLWWAWPFALVASLPGIRQLCDAGYRALARKRHHLSCRIRRG